MNGIIYKHIKILRDHGLSHYIQNFGLYAKKAANFCLYFSIAIPLLPIYFIIRLIRPLKLIRFGKLMSTRIGHFAGNTEMYMCERDHDIHPPNSLDIFYYSKPISNKQLLRMWKRVLHINQIAYGFSILNSIIPGGDIHKIKTTAMGEDVKGIMGKSKVHLYFTPEEISEAKSDLSKIGIKEDTPFICLYVRDSAYLEKHLPHLDWEYHNYRDCDIQNYILAADEISKLGFYVIRMGAIVNKAMNTKNPKIIDYAFNGSRTELLDLYLPAICRFFISGGSAGLDSIPSIFRKPILYVDYDKLGYPHTWNCKSIITIKKLWIKDKHRFMTFREILDSGLGIHGNSHVHKSYGLEEIESNSEEILDVTIEMNARLNGTWETTEEDEKLQKRFKKLYGRYDPNRVFNSRIGTKFLRQNRTLLE